MQKDILEKLKFIMTEEIAKYKTYATDGWTEKEVVKFVWEALTDVISEIQKISKEYSLTSDEKKQIAVEFIKWCYFDKECLNNPSLNIVTIPDFVETIFEKWVINNLVPDAIEKIVAIFKKFGINGFNGQKDLMIQIPNESINAY
jgi:hypothetical protein